MLQTHLHLDPSWNLKPHPFDQVLPPHPSLLLPCIDPPNKQNGKKRKESLQPPAMEGRSPWHLRARVPEGPPPLLRSYSWRSPPSPTRHAQPRRGRLLVVPFFLPRGLSSTAPAAPCAWRTLPVCLLCRAPLTPPQCALPACVFTIVLNGVKHHLWLRS